MPRSYPAEFRRRAIALVKSGRSVTQTALDLEVTQATIYAWIKQDRIDRGEIPGRTTEESTELRKARRRIRELEAEVEILRRAHEMLGPDAVRPKGFTRRSTPSSTPGSA
jgi:transposase-like protein